MTTLLLADGHAVVREGVKRVLETAPEFHLVAEAATEEEALELAAAAHPDLVVLEIAMPGGCGIETMRELKRRNPSLRVLIFTVQPEDFGVRCLREGADGYVTKTTRPEELLTALRRIAGGGKYLTPALGERVAEELERGSGRPGHERLSSREMQVLLRIAAGRTVSEIAGELQLSVKTVSTYRARLLEKLALRNNAELMRFAIALGLAK